MGSFLFRCCTDIGDFCLAEERYASMLSFRLIGMKEALVESTEMYCSEMIYDS